MTRRQQIDRLDVRLAPNRAEMAAGAAADIAQTLKRHLAKGPVKMVFAAAPSQSDTLALLAQDADIDWSRVTALHMDEYIGLPTDHPARFGLWLDEAIFARLPFAAVHHIRPEDFADPAACAAAYAAHFATPPQLVVLGVGMNGHIAFNDPPFARFDDPADVSVVLLAEECRQQQVLDGCFNALADVPTHALTVTIPALMRAEEMICIVPGAIKQAAITAMLTEEISEACPASILRRHPQARLWLDDASTPATMIRAQG